MRTEFEELDVVVQEKEVDGYYGKFAIFMWCLIIVVSVIGFIRWNVL